MIVVTDNFLAIRDEAVRILNYAATLRVKTRPVKPTAIRLVPASQFVTKEPPLPRGCPHQNGSISEIYEEGLRFWAEAVARQITFPEWEAITWHARDAVPDFPGDVIRFFENRFEGLELRDGTRIYG